MNLWNKLINIFQPNTTSITPPKTLQEAVIAVDKLISIEDKKIIKANGEKSIIQLHHYLGRQIRNEWQLWGSSELSIHMREVHKILHPDDMSHAILMEYYKSIK